MTGAPRLEQRTRLPIVVARQPAADVRRSGPPPALQALVDASPRLARQRRVVERWQPPARVPPALQRQPGDEPQWTDNPAYEPQREGWQDNPLFVSYEQDLQDNARTAADQTRDACDALLTLALALGQIPGAEEPAASLANRVVNLKALGNDLDARFVQAAQQGQGMQEAHDELVALRDGLPKLFREISSQATAQARAAHLLPDDDARDALLTIGQDALQPVVALQAAADHRPVAPRRGLKGHQDRAHGVLDKGSVANDALGGVGGSIVTIVDIGTGGLASGGGPITAVAGPLGGALGAVGVVFGAIGVGLGINAIARGHSAETRLKKLVEDGKISDEQVGEIARFAKEKKRKKKLGGMIGTTVGVAAIAAGTLALVALGVSTMGIGALVLGLGVALIGLGLVLGKFIHRKKKRKAFEAKIAGIAQEMLGAAREDDPGGPLRQQVADLGITIADWNDDAEVNAQAGPLAAALGQRVASRRELMAMSLVNYVVGPPSAAMFDAELVLAALHLDADEVRQIAQEKGLATAQARVADKMKSW
jgi:hypothetical protein